MSGDIAEQWAIQKAIKNMTPKQYEEYRLMPNQKKERDEFLKKKDPTYNPLNYSDTDAYSLYDKLLEQDRFEYQQDFDRRTKEREEREKQESETTKYRWKMATRILIIVIVILLVALIIYCIIHFTKNSNGDNSSNNTDNDDNGNKLTSNRIQYQKK